MKYLYWVSVVLLLVGCQLPRDPYSPSFPRSSEKDVQSKFPQEAKSCYESYQKNDYKGAFQQCTLAAEHGHLESQTHLAYMYRNGEGTSKSVEKAFYWYMRAAEGHQPHAEYNLGQMYRDGEGVEKNIEQAKYWYKRAYDDGAGPMAKDRLKELH